MKRLLVLFVVGLVFSAACQAGPFVSGQVLTATQLNGVVDSKVDAASGVAANLTITGSATVPAATAAAHAVRASQVSADHINFPIYTPPTSWTPIYTGWTTNPTSITARYVKIGKQVTLILSGLDGVSTISSTISIPVTASFGGSGVVVGTASSPIYGYMNVRADTDVINMTAMTLTGAYWQVSITYFE